MSWTAISAIAEAIGAAAVVISLVYLAIQVRHNTESIRLQTFQLIIDRTAAVNSRSSDKHVADVIARGRESYLGLSNADRITFDYYMHERLLAFESALALGHLLKPTIRDVVYENLRRYFGFPGVREWWTDEDREAMAQDYEDEVERICAEHFARGNTVIANEGASP